MAPAGQPQASGISSAQVLFGTVEVGAPHATFTNQRRLGSQRRHGRPAYDSASAEDGRLSDAAPQPQDLVARTQCVLSCCDALHDVVGTCDLSPQPRQVWV